MNKQEYEAGLIGLTLIEKADKTFGKSYQNYNLYSFNKCGHTQYLQPTHVRRNHIKCNTCVELEIIKDADDIGLICLGTASNDSVLFRRYKFKVCGHESDMSTSSVKIRTTERCIVCYEEQLQVDAQAQGLTYVGASELK